MPLWLLCAVRACSSFARSRSQGAASAEGWVFRGPFSPFPAFPHSSARLPLALMLNAQENLPAIHPIQNQPAHEDCGAAVNQGVVGISENFEHIAAQVRYQVLLDKAV